MTQATIASPTGTARMPTQGSWRPLVTTSISLPYRSTERRAFRIEEVGFTAKRATTGCPVEMPPRMPPAWFDEEQGRPSLPRAHLVGVFLAGQSPQPNPSPISTPFTALMPISADAMLGVELGINRRAEPRRNAFGDHFDHRADGRAALRMPSR